MNNIIKYIGFYDIDEYKKENRNYALAAKNKMNYIIKSLEQIEYNVEVISPSWSANTGGKYDKRIIDIGNQSKLITFKTFGATSKINKILRVLKTWISLIKYILKNTEKKENIIVYHSLMLVIPILIAKKIKKFNLVLEVEEVYTDVKKYNKIVCFLEKKIFKTADKFIFSTELLDNKINEANKKNIISHGVYNFNKTNIENKKDEKIHLVYSGIIDSDKGGAREAVLAAKYLDSKYHLHILGFGSENDITELMNQIEKINIVSKCLVTYEGMLKGEQYNEFLQKCDIGLCTQVPTGEYINSSFPSKILSYLSNGLNVISVRIKSIEISKMARVINFYDRQKPEEIARLIENINFIESKEIESIMKKLDENLKIDLNKLLN